MSKYTKQQRNVIYAKALNLNSKNVITQRLRLGYGFCELAAAITLNSPVRYREIKISRDFPEYILFKPKGFNPKKHSFWYDNNIRQLVIMFCIEMTE